MNIVTLYKQLKSTPVAASTTKPSLALLAAQSPQYVLGDPTVEHMQQHGMQLRVKGEKQPPNLAARLYNEF